MHGGPESGDCFYDPEDGKIFHAPDIPSEVQRISAGPEFVQ